MILHIADTSEQVAHVRAEYVIGVIIPNLLGGGDGKCRVIFVGGVIEVTRSEANRVVGLLEKSHGNDAAAHISAMAAAVT